MSWKFFFTIFSFLIDEEIKLKVLACFFAWNLLIFKILPSSFKDPQSEEFYTENDSVKPYWNRLWKVNLCFFPRSQWEVGTSENIDQS
jgi:hypothetical protein